MEELITFIAQNPSAALIVIAMALACLFAFLLFGSFKTQVSEMKSSNTSFGDRMEELKEDINRKFNETRLELSRHRDDMGKATKSIQGDLLKTAERIFELKQDMTREVLNLRALSTDTARSLEVANQTSKIALENLNEKLGRVILIEKTIEVYNAQITKLQEGVGGTRTDLHKHSQWFTSIATALKMQKEQLQKLETDFRNKKD